MATELISLKAMDYPKDHRVGMIVPKGGSICALCEYLGGPHKCGNKDFIEAVKLGLADHAHIDKEGKAHFDPPADQYCCDFFEEAPNKVKASVKQDPDGWHAVDLDSTLAKYTEFQGMTHIGKPLMGKGTAFERVKQWLAKGEKVKIFTARARDPKAVKAIQKWCLIYFGKPLEVTDKKDEHMIDSLDDRNVKVEKNTGKVLAYGTSEGVTKSWDTRGRGEHILDKKLKGPGGTNPGGVFRGKDGVDRYVKFYKNKVQAIGEVLANSIYRDLQISAPKSEAFEHEGNIAVANDLLKGKELNEVHLTPELAREILKGFAADILTANWDAVGLEHDNVLVDGNTVHRIDNGGTFLMRAQGGYKSEALLHQVGELQTFFDKNINPAYAKITKVAGDKSFTDIPTFRQQVAAISKLEQSSGGWDKYVKDRTPGLEPKLQDKIAGMLTARTAGLIKATKDPSIDATSIWHHIAIIGFTGPQEEAIRAALSHIPPELLTHVSTVQSAKELAAKHGRYIPDDQKILFNPGNLSLRGKFGGGELAIRHDELTVVHEVGHSLFSNLTPEEKKEWLEISGWMQGTKEGQAPPYVERRPGWEPHTEDWTHKAGIKFCRYYAERNPNEHFADSFAFFMLNKAYKLSDDQRKYFEEYIFNHVKHYPQALIQSPVKAAASEIVAACVIGMYDVVHGGLYDKQKHDSIHVQGKEVREKLGHGKNTGSSGHRLTIVQRNRVNGKVTAGGEGSGCDPDVAESHGTTCGPKKQGKKPYEKMKEKVAKYQSGDYTPKGGKVSILGGIWTGNAAPVVIYKTMMTGEWHSKADLLEKMPKDVLEKWAGQHAKALAEGDTKAWSVQDRIESGIRRVAKAGEMFGQWTMEEKYDYSLNQTVYRLAMNLVQDQAKGQTGVTPELQHQALSIVQKMIDNKGLDHTVSMGLMQEYAKQVGVKDFNLLAGCMSSWVGAPDGTKAQFLKRVAADYYGNDWSKEWKDGNPNSDANDKNKFQYEELKKQALAIKALSTEYMKAAGISYLYRGLSLNGDKYEQVKAAAKAGQAVPIPLNSISGFSKNKSTAKSFGGSVVIRIKVDPESVWVASGALPHLFSSYSKSEKEYLVGSKSNTTVTVDPGDVYIKDYKDPIVPEWAKD